MASVDLEKLKDSRLFAEMSDSEIDLLTKVFQEKKMPAGTTVFIENMPGESLYLVRRGTVQISKMIAEGDEQTLVVLGAEDSFGEMAVLDGAPRSATARVLEDATLLSIKRGDFEDLCEKKPALALKLMRNIIRIFSQRIRENNEEYRAMLIWSRDRSADT